MNKSTPLTQLPRVEKDEAGGEEYDNTIQEVLAEINQDKAQRTMVQPSQPQPQPMLQMQPHVQMQPMMQPQMQMQMQHPQQMQQPQHMQMQPMMQPQPYMMQPQQVAVHNESTLQLVLDTIVDVAKKEALLFVVVLVVLFMINTEKVENFIMPYVSFLKPEHAFIAIKVVLAVAITAAIHYAKS